MTADPFDAGKSALEDGDRTRWLAADARTILNAIYAPDQWSHDDLVRLLSGVMSVPDACHMLEFIDWEDSHK